MQITASALGGVPHLPSSLELRIWVKCIRQDSGGGGVFPELREARVQKPQGGQEKDKTSFISSHSLQLAFEGCLLLPRPPPPPPAKWLSRAFQQWVQISEETFPVPSQAR